MKYNCFSLIIRCPCFLAATSPTRYLIISWNNEYMQHMNMQLWKESLKKISLAWMIFLIFINFSISFVLQRFRFKPRQDWIFSGLFFANAEVASLTAMIFFTLFFLYPAVPTWNLYSVEPRVNLQSVFSYNPFSSHPSKRLANYDVIERLFFFLGLTPLFIVLLLRRKVTLKRKTLDCSQSIVSSLGCQES